MEEVAVFTLKSYVLEVYKTGNFSKAAENLYISQPSLSASIRRLEKQIGAPLFDRSTHPVRPTACGEAYLQAVHAISTAEENFAAFVEGYSSCQTGTLTVGGSNMNISFTLPKLLKRFRADYPKIRLRVEEGNINNLRKLLQEGMLDFLVDSGDEDAENFCTYHYAPENLLLAIPAEFSCNAFITNYSMTREDILSGRHLSPDQPVLPLEKVKDVPFVFPTEETDTYKRSMHLCKKAGFTPKVVLSFHQQATVFHINNAGMGAAFVSDMLIKNAFPRPDMCYYKIGGSESFRHISFFWKKGKHMTPAMKAFLEVTEKEIHPERVD